MPGKLVLATVSHRHISGLVEDKVVNTFHFNSQTETGINGASMVSIRETLASFYKDVHSPGTTAITGFLSENLSGTGEVRIYDLGATSPRFPVHQGNFLYTPASLNDPYPEEVALCLSYQAAKVSGEDQRHKRGRLYIGPFQNNNVTGDAGRPGLALRHALTGAGAFLRDASIDGDYVWCVRSRVQDTALPVVDGWCDDSWDTQRRRGVRPTLRNTF